MTSTLDATRTQPQITVGTSVLCPDLDCGRAAEVLETWRWASTAGPVEHARTRCRIGHVFTPPSDWLVPTSA